MALLEIQGLRGTVADIEILRGVDLTVGAGEVHAIMGPNGSGKSTLAYTLVGRPGYRATAGEAVFDGASILEMPPEERARAGLFLSFQHPVEIPGVRLDHFLRAGVNAIRKARGEEQADIIKFDRHLTATAKAVEMDPALIKRSVNEGFSGGERKRNEVLQMAVFEPKLAILDEPDSGLDVDALRGVAEAINRLRSPERSVVLITHYQRILDYVVPDDVHVIIGGRIVRSGDKDLAMEIEERGYDWLDEAAKAAQPSP
jgi:Fe-S cluster assembly ATP-binding protein